MQRVADAEEPLRHAQRAGVVSSPGARISLNGGKTEVHPEATGAAKCNPSTPKRDREGWRGPPRCEPLRPAWLGLHRVPRSEGRFFGAMNGMSKNEIGARDHCLLIGFIAIVRACLAAAAQHHPRRALTGCCNIQLHRCSVVLDRSQLFWPPSP